MADGTNGWSKYEEKVFHQLKELELGQKDLAKEIRSLRDDVIVLKVKAWLFGLMGGAVITAIFQLIIKFAGK